MVVVVVSIVVVVLSIVVVVVLSIVVVVVLSIVVVGWQTPGAAWTAVWPVGVF